ncbi:MAG: hypothetical protein ABI175_02660 [Polyangiales bacterium]
MNRIAISITTVAMFACLVGVGCDKKDAPPASTSKEGDKPKTTDKAAEKTGESADKAADKTADKAVEKTKKVSNYKGTVPDESKEMMGLDLKPMGAWKPVWDADAKVAKWENDDFMKGIVIRKVSDDLETMDDLKTAAPMMMQLGTNVTKVVEDQKKTDKGWYAIVEGDGMPATLIYVRDFGANIVCSADVSKMAAPMKSLSKEDAIKACESFTAK